jgi:hypothetical protein
LQQEDKQTDVLGYLGAGHARRLKSCLKTTFISDTFYLTHLIRTLKRHPGAAPRDQTQEIESNVQYPHENLRRFGDT